MTFMSIIICAMGNQCEITWISCVAFTARRHLSKLPLLVARQPRHKILEYLLTHLLRFHSPILLRELFLSIFLAIID